MLKASCEISSPLSFLHHGDCTEAEEKEKLQGENNTILPIIFYPTNFKWKSKYYFVITYSNKSKYFVL